MTALYPSQQVITLIGTRTVNTLTGVELESTYQTTEASEAVKSFPSAGFSKASFGVFYTMGAAETSNSIEVKLEQSTDRTNWVRIVNDSTSAGVSTLTAREFTFVGTNAALATFDVFIDINYKFMRIACKETGVASAKGNVFVEVTLGGQ